MKPNKINMYRSSATAALLVLALSASTAQDTHYGRKIVETLASSAFAGRGYAGGGDRLSAEFIAEELKSMGVEPVFGKSYYQDFNISVNTLPGKVIMKLDDTLLTPGAEYLVSASSPSIKGKYKVIATTRKYLTSEERLAEIAAQSEGAFILIDSRNRKDENPEAAKKTDSYVGILKYDPLVPAGGIIILTDEKLTWEAAAEQGPRPVITLKKDLDPSEIRQAEVIIEAKYYKSYTTRNVAGIIRGSIEPDSVIMVTAHYDHLGKMGSEVFFPGANDNASGVAMLLNLAKHYSVNRPGYSVVLAAFGAEELGLLGAQAFTEDPPINLKSIRFLVNFDLAGTGDEGIKVVNGSIFRGRFDLLTRINSQMNLLPKVDIRGAACNSDHCPFHRMGVPCFFIYTLGGIQAYHDIYDRSDTLPLTEFDDYLKLMIHFFDSL